MISRNVNESLLPDRKFMSSSLEISNILLESATTREAMGGTLQLDSEVPLGELLSCFMVRSRVTEEGDRGGGRGGEGIGICKDK